MAGRYEAAEHISKITGIDKSVLVDDSLIDNKLGGNTVARRMSWASGRETTRIEDQAYCLMGIFGVNMPLLYGEGGAAFLRLQQEIIKSSSDHSIFAWELNSLWATTVWMGAMPCLRDTRKPLLDVGKSNTPHVATRSPCKHGK